MTTQQHPPGASLHLGGEAWAHPSLEARLVPIDTVTPYPGNPRRGDQEAITASIRDLGLYAGCVTQESTGHILVGNHRRHALADLGATMIPADPLDVDDVRAAAIVARDNLTSDRGGYDDADQLALLSALAAEEQLDLSGYDEAYLDALRATLDGPAGPTVPVPSLADRFVVPPFTVLDQRGGAWQDRKRQWLALGIQSEVGRGDTQHERRGVVRDGPLKDSEHYRRQGLGAVQTNLDGVDAARYGRKANARSYQGQESLDAIRGKERTLGQGLQAHRDPTTGELVYTETTAAGVSIFDPVLTELAYRWFSPPTGLVLDPFAGGSVRGIVAAALGRSYVGVELRAEQVAANQAQADSIVPRLRAKPTERDTVPRPQWHTGDSAEVVPTLSVAADLLFSCPPYADLEVYSDDPADLSNMPYDQFLEVYRTIIAASLDRLRDDRFAVWVIGEVRDRRGAYRGLVPDTVRAFTDAGASFYNEAILVTPVGSLPIRAGRQFAAGRKLGKTHQNVLVFCKGDPRAAADACGTVDVILPTWAEDEVPSG